MKLGYLFLLFFLLIFNIPDAISQKFILLQRGANEKTRLTYEIGESITYKIAAYDFFITDVIRDIQPDLIVLSENILLPKNITSVDITEKDPRNSTISNLSFLGYGGSVIFLAADAINSLYLDDRFSISRGSIITSSVLAATGFILSKLKYRFFKIGGRNKLQIVILYGE
ncbi:hypothetical protein [Aquiflexum sp.]|uniref:hypothetical protein n=1 Tax=Aquiflexum sp. TaxID=1872584 RepID=UPI0035948100